MRDMSGCYNVDELKRESNVSVTKAKCLGQQSDYGISSTNACNTKMCSNQSAAVDNVDISGDRQIRESCMSELRELPTLRRTSTRYRSTSFCQVDLHQGEFLFFVILSKDWCRDFSFHRLSSTSIPTQNSTGCSHIQLL